MSGHGDGPTIRVVVADDQDLVRTGLAMILAAQPDISVVGEAADGLQAVALTRRRTNTNRIRCGRGRRARA